MITHTKVRPVCHNETKLNCITLWTMDGKGNKVSLLQSVPDYRDSLARSGLGRISVRR